MTIWKNILAKTPLWDFLQKTFLQLEQKVAWPAGHFYSPIPAIWDIKKNEVQIFNEISKGIPGVNLNEEEQLYILKTISRYYNDVPFDNNKKKGLRYYGTNDRFILSDATTLFCMIRHFNPKRIIEIGSGFSSCVCLDTNEKFFNKKIDCTFIEPYTQLLVSLLREEDMANIKIIPQRLQDINNIKLFSSLEAGDILFLDSSHVAKTHSDVNHFFFNILPSLQSGVIIHIHDIFYPFEYLKEWLYEGRAWNETYLLKAFLQYNNAFEIIFFSSFLHIFHSPILQRHMPICTESPGGSIWLRKR